MSAAEVIDLHPTRTPLDSVIEAAQSAQNIWQEAWRELQRVEAADPDSDQTAEYKERVGRLNRAMRDAAGHAADTWVILSKQDPPSVTQVELDEAEAAIRALTCGPEVMSIMLADTEETTLYVAERDAVTEMAVDAIIEAGSVPLTVPKSIDDAHMAESFAEQIRGRYLYVAASRRWYRWDGRRWRSDDVEAVFEQGRQFVLDLSTHMLAISADSEMVKRVVGYRSRARLDALVTVTRRIDGIAARMDEFDRDPDLLNCANGIIDLRDGTLSPHDPKQRMTKLANVAYRPDATNADVEQMLEAMDYDVRAWFLALIGYAATGHTSEDVVAVMDGTGANGKTTVLEAAGDALGDYAGPAASQLIMRTGRDEHPTIKADLQGKRLVWISETEEGGSLRMEQLKALTGGDTIKARVMRGDYFDFTPTHTLVVATNHRPYVNATEHAAWRRLRLVPFPHTYLSPAEAQEGDRVMDRGLRRRLKGIQQREAMLARIVAGAFSWYKTGLPESPTIEAATLAWRRSEDVILRFIDEELAFDADTQITGRDLYLAYTDWCRNEGRPAKSNKNFATEFLSHAMVQEAGVNRVNVSNVSTYRGVRKAI